MNWFIRPKFIFLKMHFFTKYKTLCLNLVNKYNKLTKSQKTEVRRRLPDCILQAGKYPEVRSSFS